jgi:hypothetical protein
LALKDESVRLQMPNTRVLINACHGGFSLSSAFKEWDDMGGDECDDPDDEQRVRMAGRMTAFGAHVAERHPTIPAIMAVLASPAGKALSNALLAARVARIALETVGHIDENLRTLDAALWDEWFDWKGPEEGPMAPYALTAPPDALTRYRLGQHSRTEAQKFRDTFDIAALRQEYQTKAEEASWAAALPAKVAIAIGAFGEPPKVARNDHGTFIDELVAAEACDDLRRTAALARVWAFISPAAAFLACVLSDGPKRRPAVHGHYFGDSRDSTEATFETVGLLAASGMYAWLAIREAPRLAGWTVTEYDGLERVSVL